MSKSMIVPIKDFLVKLNSTSGFPALFLFNGEHSMVNNLSLVSINIKLKTGLFSLMNHLLLQRKCSLIKNKNAI